MDDVAQWLVQVSWTGWFAGAAVATAIGAVIAAVISLTSNRKPGAHDPDDPERENVQDRDEFSLLCGDAKALVDLAIQRHMSDADFLRRLQAQPFFVKLSPVFSEDFRQRLTQESPSMDGRTRLALACQEEIRRMEREVQAPK